MEETKKRFPSLPTNYVSLQQLQEQRLREQQQKQKEKEEEEEEKKRVLVSQKAPRIKSKTSYDQTSNRNGRNFSQKSWLIKEKNEAGIPNPDQKLEEVEPKRQKKKKNRYRRNGTSDIQKGEIEINVGTSDIQKGEIEINVGVKAVELPDPDQNLKEIETKKKKKKHKSKKPKAEEETLIEDLKELLPPSAKTPAMIPNENDAGVKNTRNSGLRRRVKKPPPPESVSLNQTMEIEQKIGDLRICDDEKKSTVEKNGDYSSVMRSRKIINRRKPMDGNLMWIRKDEKSGETPVVSGYIAGKSI